MNVTVDNDFARFGSKSYAINKINSVEVRERQPYGQGGAVLCGIVALLCAGGGYEAVKSGGEPAVPAILAVAFGIGAYRLWQKSKIREFLLFLMTSSSETQAFVTRSEGEVAALRDEIEAAMLHHSRLGYGAPRQA
ncbi:MAG: DUF6232 family protein [Sphingomonas phyllosphaerae]